MLDDHIVKTQTMRGSPYAKPFQDEIGDWDSLLQNMQDTIDEWTACQSTWLYLEPIFSSEDIMKQMPVEGKKFKKVDKTYRGIMDKIFATPACLKAAKIPNVLEDLQESNKLLEDIQKGLNAYLEVKRLYFPRFFFLSNDELLEILAETKDPLRVQPHLKKCFDGLTKLEFTDTLTIVSMCSSEKEVVPLVEVLDPATARGNVEVWLLDLERVMRDTLKQVCQDAIADYPTKDRIEWTACWPGQLVLNVSQLYWTKDFEEACSADGSAGVARYCETLEGYLDAIINAVRGDLPKLARRTLSALTVIDVHARDVMLMLKQNGVSDPNDFDWMSQLRYYWEEGEDPELVPGESLQVKMISSVLEYGYEYIGNSGRLVITPLTDRCYRTLMGALHLQYGGAPEGPAGTGKTETVKDLSKALARQCVVFNCSDQLDYLAMAKFFKGLASAGAWACFDEFNRIKLEVLSVVAQQVTQIQQAVAARLTEFDFEGSHITLKWTANSFITMNPGYAGRASLPDNLKALFRTVAMMVPDYAMIAEIILMSFGYEHAKHLSTKITSTYKLCSEQLSSQKHYDYGMRAVMAVIRAAGNLKRKYGEENEEILMLRAINDVNLAKFLSPDIPLFNGITSDLFPGVTLPEPDYKDLLDAINVNVNKYKLQPEPNFLEKVVQLYEMVVVRHGLMVVGDPFAGKTCNIRCLAGALTVLNERKQMPCAFGDCELATDMILMNPKSVTMGQLYGCFDDVSHEWTDGVLAIQYRKAATANDGRRKWVIFDGPVDAIWIENMNTVLDDNKKLCLNSGEIIQMSAEMTMMFEPKDLEVASPATVSRCGMVFMEPHRLGWRPLVASWYDTLPASITGSEKVKKSLEQNFEWLIDGILFYVRRECKELAPTSPIMMINSMITLFTCLIDEFQDPEVIGAVAEKDLINWVDGIFLFSLVWSCGGSLNGESREKFDAKLRAMVAGEEGEEKPPKKMPMMFPAAGLVYGYTFEKAGKGKWKKWDDVLDKNFSIDPKAKFSSIMVPTSDTARYTFLADHLLSHTGQILFVGGTGTGKTIDLHTYLLSLPDEKFSVLETQFSAQTSANQTQDVIDQKLDKRRKGIFGPAPGKRMMIFVDDLNMPEVEEYGAQPPLELLRQFMDHGGWYDLKEMTFRNLVDIQFCTAMGPPGGGRNHITPRLVRHFNVVGMTEVESGVLIKIFTTVMNWFVSSKGISSEVAKLATKSVVEGTLHVYEESIKNLLPTPAKSHYLFNLRDYSRIIQGVCMVRANEIGTDKEKFIRLWIHECTRVVADRLIDDEGKGWFLGMMKETTKAHFNSSFDAVCNFLIPEGSNEKEITLTTLRNLMWGDYKVPGAEPKLYDEIESINGIHKVIDEYLDEYNAMATKPMNLVMFNFAIEHTSRLSRIFKIPGGNALLVGVGGSGRQSLSRLATFMAEFDCFQIEISKSYGINEWYEDIKKCLLKAGGEGKPTVFLFTDTQVKMESFVEDINNVLNTGEIPNLFPADEKAQIVEMVRGAAKSDGLKLETPGEFYSYFLGRVRDNLHISLCFSPIGDAFRTRLRQFPSLINCCTIDWFTAWPDDALQSVAQKFLEEVEFKDDQTRSGSMQMCIEFHMTTRRFAGRFLSELRRNYYVTPTSYLELINTFKTILGKKRAEVSSAKKRYDVGLDKLITTEKSVEGMKQEIIELQPVLVKTTKEVEDMMVVVDKETKGAEEIKTVVQGEEAIAQGKADEANTIKTECEADLAEAMPILHAALSALDTLNKSDIVEVKAMKTPPSGVKLTMEALCHFFNVKAVKVKDPNDPTKKVQDYWEPAKKDILGDSKMLDNLKAYDRDNIDPGIIKKMQKYMGNPDFDPEVVKKASKAAYGLCCWARAMVSYDRVAKVVAPKKEKLAAAEAEYAEVMVGLKQKQAELKKVMDKLGELDKQLKGCVEKKKQLADQIEDCKAKLIRAEKLINGLGGEKHRWGEASVQLGEVYENLVSDVLISSGVIAYLGAFTADYRNEIISGWKSSSLEAGLTPSEDYSLDNTLGEPVKIRHWNICGLPSDSFSTENGIIVDMAKRWPLMIDPQGQANIWVRNLEAEAELVVIKLTDADYLRQMELSLQFGKPVLLENIGEELDSALEPVLLKQVFKKGGVMMIKLGEALVEYSDQFRFYMTTTMRNPHYLPEVSVKVTLLNFMITPTGLQEQMLGIVVAKEKPELQEEKDRLILESAANKKQLKEIEDKILHVLSSSKGNILDDASAIEVLTEAKIVSDDIAEKQAVAEETEKRIDEARLGYTPVAIRASALFFCISDLANIEPTYQYSLVWFTNIFLFSIDNSEPSNQLQQRIDSLCEYFTYMLYKNVCRSLFEKDKLLFSFVLAVKILQAEQPEVTPANEFRFLLTGGAVSDIPSNPYEDWLPERSWGEFYRLEQAVPLLAGIVDSIKHFESEWKAIYDSDAAHKAEFPGPFKSATKMQRLCLVRCIRPDRVVPAVQDFIVTLRESNSLMGQRYIEPPAFDLLGPFEESNSITPIIFILSPGSDPMLTIYNFAEKQEIPVNALSLGQGQGPLAEKMIGAGSGDGSWVILQNCHVYPSWMTTLERICEEFDIKKNHKQFRLWLTSYPSKDLPVAVLQNGVKLTNEPPKGLRANLIGSYGLSPICEPEFFDGCAIGPQFHKLLYGLCFFHAIIQERRKFGPLGWNIPYEFNESDLRISVRQLQMFLNDNADKEMPFKALMYITGQCNYGGRVTDPFDRTCLVAILKTYYCTNMLDDDYKLSSSGLYVAPEDNGYESTLDFVKALPLNAGPEVFGMHTNADITKDQNETFLMMDSIMLTQARASGGGGDGPEAAVDKAAASMLAKLPQVYDVELIQAKYPVLYEESMNTVLCQELIRFNKLIDTIRSSLTNVKKAIVGLVVMSAQLDLVFNSVYDGKIPALWKGSSYPSLKPLGGYYVDMLARLSFFQAWVDNGMPITFWLSGFFFTQGFLTGASQNYARANTIPIDTLGYTSKFMPQPKADVDKMAKPDSGVYTYGLYLEGARWDYDTAQLGESNPKELFTQCPVIWMRPWVKKDIPFIPHYNCPLYKTSDRRGILSTTGHSTNFVMPITTPSDQPPEHWIKRGVAMLTQLDT
jgi:dynein heavy chain